MQPDMRQQLGVPKPVSRTNAQIMKNIRRTAQDDHPILVTLILSIASDSQQRRTSTQQHHYESAVYYKHC
jgi:hypothetical protein